MSLINKITVGTTNYNIADSAYFTCDTAATTANKSISGLSTSEIVNGLSIKVKFTYTNTAANPKLYVGSTGYSIYRYGTTAAGTAENTSWVAGEVVEFTFVTSGSTFAAMMTGGSSNFSGSYNDLTNKPTIPTVNNGTLTIQKNGTQVATFTANQSSNSTANITVPTKTSELSNDSGFITSYNNQTVKGAGTAFGANAAVNIAAGSNVTVTPNTSTNTITIAATDTTYESKEAASGGTAVSLVTTGEKYTWNNKVTNAGAKPNLNDGTTITQPADTGAFSIKTTGWSRDTGIFRLSEDGAYICNSCDNGYGLAVFDTDSTNYDYSNGDNADLCVPGSGGRIKTRGKEYAYASEATRRQIEGEGAPTIRITEAGNWTNDYMILAQSTKNMVDSGNFGYIRVHGVIGGWGGKRQIDIVFDTRDGSYYYSSLGCGNFSANGAVEMQLAGKYYDSDDDSEGYSGEAVVVMKLNGWGSYDLYIEGTQEIPMPYGTGHLTMSQLQINIPSYRSLTGDIVAHNVNTTRAAGQLDLY